MEKIQAFSFLFVESVGAVRARLFSLKHREHITRVHDKETNDRKKKRSFPLCDVTAEAEMFLDLEKNNCDHLGCFVLFCFGLHLFSPELYVTKLNILIKTVCYLSS